MGWNLLRLAKSMLIFKRCCAELITQRKHQMYNFTGYTFMHVLNVLQTEIPVAKNHQYVTKIGLEQLNGFEDPVLKFERDNIFYVLFIGY